MERWQLWLATGRDSDEDSGEDLQLRGRFQERAETCLYKHTFPSILIAPAPDLSGSDTLSHTTAFGYHMRKGVGTAVGGFHFAASTLHLGKGTGALLCIISNLGNLPSNSSSNVCRCLQGVAVLCLFFHNGIAHPPPLPPLRLPSNHVFPTAAPASRPATL